MSARHYVYAVPPRAGYTPRGAAGAAALWRTGSAVLLEVSVGVACAAASLEPSSNTISRPVSMWNLNKQDRPKRDHGPSGIGPSGIGPSGITARALRDLNNVQACHARPPVRPVRTRSLTHSPCTCARRDSSLGRHVHPCADTHTLGPPARQGDHTRADATTASWGGGGGRVKGRTKTLQWTQLR